MKLSDFAANYRVNACEVSLTYFDGSGGGMQIFKTDPVKIENFWISIFVEKAAKLQ